MSCMIYFEVSAQLIRITFPQQPPDDSEHRYAQRLCGRAETWLTLFFPPHSRAAYPRNAAEEAGPRGRCHR